MIWGRLWWLNQGDHVGGIMPERGNRHLRGELDNGSQQMDCESDISSQMVHRWWCLLLGKKVDGRDVASW